MNIDTAIPTSRGSVQANRHRQARLCRSQLRSFRISRGWDAAGRHADHSSRSIRRVAEIGTMGRTSGMGKRGWNKACQRGSLAVRPVGWVSGTNRSSARAICYPRNPPCSWLGSGLAPSSRLGADLMANPPYRSSCLNAWASASHRDSRRTPLGLPPKPARLDIFHQQRAGRYPESAKPSCSTCMTERAGIEPNEVGQFQGPIG